jgi:protein involved in polysaccharide export with SLBB domain
MKFALDKNLNFTKGSSDILLENGDQVIIRTISGYEGIRMVRVDGEVLQPGTYNITNKAERISDLIKRAGGFTNYAYPYGAFLIRSESASAVEQKLKQIMAENAKKQLQTKTDKSIDIAMLEAAGATTVQGFSDMDSIQKNLSGSKVVEDIFSPEGIVGINLSEIMKNPNGKYDLNLEEGDVVFVPRELQTIRVLGEVLFPTFVRYDNAMTFKDYVSNAGGFSERAHKSKAFVLYANGTARSTKNFLGIKFYPTIKPGARIVVPEKPIEIKNKMSTGETISLMTSITSVVALIYYMIK